MEQPTYQIWILNEDYSKKCMLRNYTSLEYSLKLNDYGSAYIDLDPTNPHIPDIDVMDRLLILRNETIVFGGYILRETITIPGEAPQGEAYNIASLDYACFADWRVVMPTEGEDHDTRTGPADDVCKEYVDICMGPSALAARQISEVTIASDLSAASEITYDARNVILLTVLKNIHDQAGVDWRFVPGTSGCTFMTKYPHWGLDRTKGNGVRPEVIFSIDRRNFNELTYQLDILQHYNYFYSWGQGEGVDRAMAEGGDATYISMYKRRERYDDNRHIELEASLEEAIALDIEEEKPVQVMSVDPLYNTFITQWDLGDQITLDIKRYGRTITMDMKIVGIKVTLHDDGTELIQPELERC